MAKISLACPCKCLCMFFNMLHCQLTTIDLVLYGFHHSLSYFFISLEIHISFETISLLQRQRSSAVLFESTVRTVLDCWLLRYMLPAMNAMKTVMAINNGVLSMKQCFQIWNAASSRQPMNCFFERTRTRSLHMIVFVVCCSTTLSGDGNTWLQPTTWNCDFKFCHGQELFVLLFGLDCSLQSSPWQMPR